MMVDTTGGFVTVELPADETRGMMAEPEDADVEEEGARVELSHTRGHSGVTVTVTVDGTAVTVTVDASSQLDAAVWVTVMKIVSPTVVASSALADGAVAVAAALVVGVVVAEALLEVKIEVVVSTGATVGDR